jgi:uncharacterized protein
MQHVFRSRIFIVPGLGNSGEGHWQTIWQTRFGFQRIEQSEWDRPVCTAWINTINTFLISEKANNVILVGHSLACNTIAAWAKEFGTTIKGALLVAPSDTEADSYPPGTTGFKPMVLRQLPFPSITIASSNDPYVTTSRARTFANAWGSKLIEIGNAGHINVASGQGNWEAGLRYLEQLDAVSAV